MKLLQSACWCIIIFFLFLNSDLSRFNLHILKFTMFRYTVPWILINIYRLVTTTKTRYRIVLLSWEVPFHSSPTFTPGNNWSTLCSYSSVILRMSYKWHHTACSLLILSSLSINLSNNFIHYYCMYQLVVHSVLLLSSTWLSSYGCMDVS